MVGTLLGWPRVRPALGSHPDAIPIASFPGSGTLWFECCLWLPIPFPPYVFMFFSIYVMYRSVNLECALIPAPFCRSYAFLICNIIQKLMTWLVFLFFFFSGWVYLGIVSLQWGFTCMSSWAVSVMDKLNLHSTPESLSGLSAVSPQPLAAISVFCGTPSRCLVQNVAFCVFMHSA